MAHRRHDVVDRAIAVLDGHGVDGLTMRRLATDLGVQPAALYHHFAGKDALLAAVADELLARGARAAEVVTWDAELRLAAAELRDAMLAVRDGARLVARVHALGLGADAPERRMRAALTRAGADDDLARVGARTIVHFVFGHAADHAEDGAEGAAEFGAEFGAEGAAGGVADAGADFHLGMGLIVDGLAARLP